MGEVCVHLLSCRTHIAPINSISSPRHDLCGAVLGSELLPSILREIDVRLVHVYCWSYSTIVLFWLKKTASTWATFVANRVNPADLSSRGLHPADLAAIRLWWQSLTKTHWSICDLIPSKLTWKFGPLEVILRSSAILKIYL